MLSTPVRYEIISFQNPFIFRAHSQGVLDRMTGTVHLYSKASQRGGKADVEEIPLDDEELLKSKIDDDELYDKLIEDSMILEELINPLDMDRVSAGEQSPLFFGSAMTNFGVQLFLDKFCDMGTKPLGRVVGKQQQQEQDHDESDGAMISPEHPEFTGFIFKTQANLDPKHR